MFQRHYNGFREELAKLKTPLGLEEEVEENIDPKAMQYSTESTSTTALAGSSSVASIASMDIEMAGPSSAKEIV